MDRQENDLSEVNCNAIHWYGAHFYTHVEPNKIILAFSHFY